MGPGDPSFQARTPQASSSPTTDATNSKPDSRTLGRAARPSTSWDWSAQSRLRSAKHKVGGPSASSKGETYRYHPSSNGSSFPCGPYGFDAILSSVDKPMRTNGPAPVPATDLAQKAEHSQTRIMGEDPPPGSTQGPYMSISRSDFVASPKEHRPKADSISVRPSASFSATASSGHQSSGDEVRRAGFLGQGRSTQLPASDKALSLDGIDTILALSSESSDASSARMPTSDTDYQDMPAQQMLPFASALRNTVSTLMNIRLAHSPSVRHAASGPTPSLASRVPRFSAEPNHPTSVTSHGELLSITANQMAVEASMSNPELDFTTRPQTVGSASTPHRGARFTARPKTAGATPDPSRVNSVSSDGGRRYSTSMRVPSDSAAQLSTAASFAPTPTSLNDKRHRSSLFSRLRAKVWPAHSQHLAEAEHPSESRPRPTQSSSTEDGPYFLRNRLYQPFLFDQTGMSTLNVGHGAASSSGSGTASGASHDGREHVPPERSNRTMSGFALLLGPGQGSLSGSKGGSTTANHFPTSNVRDLRPAMKRPVTADADINKDRTDTFAHSGSSRSRRKQGLFFSTLARPAPSFLSQAHAFDTVYDRNLQEAPATLETSQMLLAEVQPSPHSSVDWQDENVLPSGISQSESLQRSRRPALRRGSTRLRHNPPSQPPTICLPPTPPMVRNVRLARDVEAHLHRRPATSHGERRSVTPVRSRTRSSSFNAPDYPRADLGVKKATAHEARSSSEIEGIEDDYTTADTLERLRIPAIEAAQQRLKEMHSPSPTFLAAMHDPFRSSSESIGPSIGSGNDEPSSSAGQHLSDIDLSLRRSTSEFDMQKIKRARELAHAFRAKEQGRNSSLSPSRRLARQSMHDLSTRAVSGVESPEGTLSHVQRRRLSKAMPLLLTQKAPLHPLPSLPPVPPGESISGRHVDETSSHPLNRQFSSNTARFEPSNEILANVGTGRSGEDDAPRYPRSAKSSSSVEPFTGPPTVSSHGGADDVEAVLEAASGPVWPHSFDSHATDHRRVTFAVEDQGRDNSVVSGSSDSIQTTLDKNRSNDTSSAQDHHGSHDQVCAPSLDLTPLKTMTRADLVYRRSSAALRSRNSSGGLSTTTTAAMTGITSTTTEHKRVRHASIASHRSMDGVSLLFLRSQAYPPPSPSSSSFRSIPRRASNPVLRKPLLLPLRQTPSPTGRAFEGRCASSSPDGSGPSSASLHR